MVKRCVLLWLFPPYSAGTRERWYGMEILHTPEKDRLFEAILKLGSVEECYSFFEDICTIKELLDISQRLKVADMLMNKKSYQEIARATGASTVTISRVNRCLLYGSGGYRMMLERLAGGTTEEATK